MLPLNISTPRATEHIHSQPHGHSTYTVHPPGTFIFPGCTVLHICVSSGQWIWKWMCSGYAFVVTPTMDMGFCPISPATTLRLSLPLFSSTTLCGHRVVWTDNTVQIQFTVPMRSATKAIVCSWYSCIFNQLRGHFFFRKKKIQPIALCVANDVKNVCFQRKWGWRFILAF